MIDKPVKPVRINTTCLPPPRVDNLTIASLCCDRCVAVILNVLKYVTLVNYYHAGRNADLSLSIHQVQLQS